MEYDTGQTGSGDATNVYNYKPADQSNFIAPYQSHAAEGPSGKETDWKFMGWKLTGDVIEATRDDIISPESLGNLILPAVHTVACDYHLRGATGASDTTAQYFKIYNTAATLSGTVTNGGTNTASVSWTGDETTESTKVYANVHKGLTMVAQWRHRQRNRNGRYGILQHDQQRNRLDYNGSDEDRRRNDDRLREGRKRQLR